MSLEQQVAGRVGGEGEGEDGEEGGGGQRDKVHERAVGSLYAESKMRESEHENVLVHGSSRFPLGKEEGEAKVRGEHGDHEGDGRRSSKSRSLITPHSLSPEEYSSALPKDPSLYTIGFERLDEIQSDDTGFVNANGQDQLFFLTGNPSVQQYKGQVRICKNNLDGSLSRERNTQLCILAVPMFMTIADFCRFLGPLMENIVHMRIVHDDSKARYIVLMDFDSQRR
eukprot:760947-Hanusia_phi.AAC.4